MNEQKTAGQLAYEAELTARPTYDDGTPRPPWKHLGEIPRLSWERNPAPRWGPTEPADYESRVQAYEAQGMTRSDAQGVVDAELLSE